MIRAFIAAATWLLMLVPANAAFAACTGEIERSGPITWPPCQM